MPIYEFDCQQCGEPFEELVLSTSTLAQVTCPGCGSLKIKKKVSTFSAKVSGGASSARTSSGASCAPGGV